MTAKLGIFSKKGAYSEPYGFDHNNGIVIISSKTGNISQETASSTNGDKLENAVNDLAENHPQHKKDLDKIARLTKRTMEDAKTSLFSATAKGLKEAAEALSGIAPSLIDIVSKIIRILQ